LSRKHFDAGKQARKELMRDILTSNNRFNSTNHQFSQRISYAEHYSVHVHMTRSQKFRLTPAPPLFSKIVKTPAGDYSDTPAPERLWWRPWCSHMTCCGSVLDLQTVGKAQFAVRVTILAFFMPNCSNLAFF